MFAFMWALIKFLFWVSLVIWVVLRILKPRLIVQGVNGNEVVRVRSGLGWMFMDLGKTFGFMPPLWQLVKALFVEHVMHGKPTCNGKFRVKNVGSVVVDVKCFSNCRDVREQVALLEGIKPGEWGVIEMSKVQYPLVFGVESSKA